nr:hypothetical protein [Tanacetum cinerariifolium]
MIKEACKEDGDDVLGSSMEVREACKEDGDDIHGSSMEVKGKLSSLAVGTSSGSGNSSLTVGMPCAFYSQQSSPKLDAPSVIKFPE